MEVERLMRRHAQLSQPAAGAGTDEIASIAEPTTGGAASHPSPGNTWKEMLVWGREPTKY